MSMENEFMFRTGLAMALMSNGEDGLMDFDQPARETAQQFHTQENQQQPVRSGENNVVNGKRPPCPENAHIKDLLEHQVGAQATNHCFGRDGKITPICQPRTDLTDQMKAPPPDAGLIHHPPTTDFDAIFEPKNLQNSVGHKSLEFVCSPLAPSPTRAEALAMYDAANHIATNQVISSLPLVNSSSVVSSAEACTSPLKGQTKHISDEQYPFARDIDFTSSEEPAVTAVKNEPSMEDQQFEMQNRMVSQRGRKGRAIGQGVSPLNSSEIGPSRVISKRGTKSKQQKSIQVQVGKLKGTIENPKIPLQPTSLLEIPDTHIDIPQLDVNSLATAPVSLSPAPSRNASVPSRVPSRSVKPGKVPGVASNGVRNSKTKSRASGKKPTRTDPSRFCHICTRSVNSVEVAYCSNIAKGECRKIICIKCASNFGLDDVKTAIRNPVAAVTWICQHCRKCCPGKAQCGTYGRINLLRREKGRIRKEAKAAALAAAETLGAVTAAQPVGSVATATRTVDELYQNLDEAISLSNGTEFATVVENNVSQNQRHSIRNVRGHDLSQTQGFALLNSNNCTIPSNTISRSGPSLQAPSSSPSSMDLPSPDGQSTGGQVAHEHGHVVVSQTPGTADGVHLDPQSMTADALNDLFVAIAATGNPAGSQGGSPAAATFSSSNQGIFPAHSTIDGTGVGEDRSNFRE